MPDLVYEDNRRSLTIRNKATGEVVSCYGDYPRRFMALASAVNETNDRLDNLYKRLGESLGRVSPSYVPPTPSQVSSKEPLSADGDTLGDGTEPGSPGGAGWSRSSSLMSDTPSQPNGTPSIISGTPSLPDLVTGWTPGQLLENAEPLRVLANMERLEAEAWDAIAVVKSAVGKRNQQPIPGLLAQIRQCQEMKMKVRLMLVEPEKGEGELWRELQKAILLALKPYPAARAAVVAAIAGVSKK